jgi:oligopeptide/dipeptide ABC transporter ATP-binding protein
MTPNPPTTNLLEVRGLRVHFPVRRSARDVIARVPRRIVLAVDGVSFSVGRGELVALVGESGSGKTTTALALLALQGTDGGVVNLSGQSILHIRRRKLREFRRHVQVVFQDPYESLDPRYRVRRLVEEPLIIHDLGSRAQRRQKVIEALERVGLSPADLYLERFPHELSGGQRQRVAIASALVLEPDLLVADEPVSMLDVSMRAGILELLDQLRSQGLGVLMITHDLSTAALYADTIAVMYLGRIIEQGPAQDVVKNPAHPYTKALLSVVPSPDPANASTPTILAGEIPDPSDIPRGCRFHPRCPSAMTICAEVEPDITALAEDHWAACLLLEKSAISKMGYSDDAT